MTLRPSLLLSLFLGACGPDTSLTKFNSDPAATITTPSDGAEVLAGTLLSLRGAVSDPNDGMAELSVTWFVSDAEVCAAADPASDGTTACDTVAPAADAEVRLEVRDPEGAVAVARAALVVLPNSAPEASIVSPVAGDIYYSDQLITFQGVVGDAEDAADTLTVWWESNVDGALDVEATPTLSGEVLGYGTLTEGEHAIELHALDSAGNEAVESVTIEVGAPNSAPTCAITAPADGGSGEEGELVTFRGTVADVDVAADWLDVTWQSDKDGAFGTSAPTSGGGVTLPYEGLSVNTHVVTMQVVDEIGATCSAEVLYTVGSPPTIALAEPVDGEVVNDGESLTFTATVADGEDRASDLVVRWESSLDGVLREGAPDSSGVSQFRDSGLSVGAHELTVTVTDSDGFYASALGSFTINGIPSAPSVSLTPDPAATDDDLRANLDVVSVDPEGAALTYAYAWSVDSVLSAASVSAALPASATTRGEVWSVSVTATDGLATSAAGSATVTIENTAPTLATLSLSPDPAWEGDTLTCTAGATADADGDAVGLTYDWTVSGSPLGYDSATLEDGYFDRGDTITCTATPTDGTDDGATRTSNTVTIENSEPSIASVTVSPASPTLTSTLTCAYTDYDDADGDADQSTYAWTIGGSTVGTGSTLAGAFASGDIVTCTVTPDDGTDAGTALADSVTVDNTAPVLASVTLSPDPAAEGDTLTCTPGATTDADGTTAFTYGYVWTVNGASIAATTRTLTGTYFDSGDDVACAVTPSDGTDAGAAVASNTVTIGNTAPTLATLSLSPDPAWEGDTLTCTAGATADADGDVVGLTYDWTVSGSPLGYDSATLEDTYFDRGDSVACTATPTDGTDDGATRTSNTVTIENSEPSIASVTVSPASPTVASTLTCSYTDYDDADGDADQSTYAWTVGGATVGTGSTLAGAFASGDIVTCTVTPDDGTDAGTALADSVTVDNTAPVLASVTLSPDPAAEGDTLTCTPGATTDADGTTAFTYGYVWTVNGASIAATTRTLTGTYFDSGDDVACGVTPSDGTDAGAAVASNTVTIENTAPVLTTVAVSPTSGAVGDTLTCSASATDADGDSVTLTYGWSTGATGASLTLTASNDPGDVLTCTATATDPSGDTDTGTDTATVDNADPTVTTVAVSPSSGRVGDTLVCTATATDADGGTPTLSYAWSTGATGASIALTASNDPGDVLTCTATATDADGGTGAGTDTATVVNTEPVVGTVSISPSSAYNDDLLTCSATATDADGGSPTLAYAWTNTSDATSIGSGATLSLTSALAGSRETVACTVTGTDADGGTDSGSASLTLGNRSPVAAVSLSPSSATRTSTLTCTGSATDADDDATSLSFGWTVDGTTTAASATASTSSTLASAFAAGDVVACTVTASDGKTGSDTDTASVTIGNTAPVVSSVTLSPSTVATNDTLTASVVSSDADGDALSLSYAWYVDGVAVATGSSLSGVTYFDRDEVVYVEVTADDGTDTDSETSSSVTVENTAPTAPEIEITPEDAEAGDDLTCSVVTASTDDDGDAVTYSFAWDVDGVAYTGATDAATESVVDGGDVGGDETWTCEGVASDGVEESGVAQTTVSVTCVAGTSEVCAGLDCLDILNGSPSASDGTYWIDPTGSSPYQVYCDMTTDGGGWTLVMKAVNSNYTYDHTVWTTAGVDNETDLSLTSPGEAKYQSFNEVAFTDIRSSDPTTLATDIVETFSSEQTSALDLYSGSGTLLEAATYESYYNSRAPATSQAWGCTGYDRYGFSLYDSLGCTYLGSGLCDHNGGARWGNRINRWLCPTCGDLIGQGWGSYSCGDSTRPSFDTGPSATVMYVLSELMWVR